MTTKTIRAWICAAALAAVAACDMLPPQAPVSSPPRPAAAAPSEASQELARYYRRIQNDGQTRGLLRTDGGGPDTPYTADMLARNFERIAFFSEYSNGAATGPAGQTPLRRWTGPVLIRAAFGPSVPPDVRARDEAALRAYTGRLARITRHPISYAGPDARGVNFTVIFAGEDDRASTRDQLQAIRPWLGRGNIDRLMSIDRNSYCIVQFFGALGDTQAISHAVAIIRSEQPDLMRLSCIHEEVAQGLGLANDSPRARPSIFNDDDEFALLTSMDEKMLAMLYDPRLHNGMTLEEAAPVVRILAREALGASL